MGIVHPRGLSILLLLLVVAAVAAAQTVHRGAIEITVEPNVSEPLRKLPPIPPTHARHSFPIFFPHRPTGEPSQPATFYNDPATQATSGPLISTNPGGLNFDGVGTGFTGFTVPGSPSDANVAVGANQVVQWVNTSFAVFDKSTGAVLLGPVTGNTVFSGLTHCGSTNDGDPTTLWDKFAQRWVMSQLSISSGAGYYQCLAVSQTADATGAWIRYEFPMPDFNDYPKLSVWPDSSNNYYLFSFNQFTTLFGFVLGYKGPEACAFQRSAVLQAQPAGLQCVLVNNTAYSTLLPADVDGTMLPPSGSPGLFVSLGTVDASGNGSSLAKWVLKVDWSNKANTTLTGPSTIAVSPYSEACGGGTCVPQPGTSQQLDTIADRLMYRLPYRNFGTHESVLAAHSVNSPYSTTGVRWYEIQNPFGTPTVFQQGTYAVNDSNYRWMPALAMDKAGDIAIGYSISNGSNLYPSLAIAGRVPSDPANTLESENIWWTGSGAQLNDPVYGGGNRWGDYWSMSIDPADDCTFWTTGEYEKTSGSFNWSTRVFSFSLPNCTGNSTSGDFTIGASAITPANSTIYQGQSATYNISIGAVSGFNGTVTLSASNLPPGVSASFNPTSIAGSGSSTLTLIAASNAATGTFSNITVSGTSGSTVHSTNVTLSVQAAPTFSISATATSPTRQKRGSRFTWTVTIATQNFPNPVSLGVSGQPSNSTVSWSTNPVSAPGSSTLTIQTFKNTGVGTFTLKITGTGNNGISDVTQSTTASMTVTNK